MTAPFHFGSPRELRERAKREDFDGLGVGSPWSVILPPWAGHARSADIMEMQAEVSEAMEQWRADVEQYAKDRDDIRLERIQRFRLTLPDCSRGWFDLLSIDDQFRLTQPTTRESGDTQRDYDEEREHGWSV